MFNYLLSAFLLKILRGPLLHSKCFFLEKITIPFFDKKIYNSLIINILIKIEIGKRGNLLFLFLKL
jgi:hypothetical protein